MCECATHFLVHIALMVFPGSGGLVNFSFTVDAVIHQDKTPEHRYKSAHVIRGSLLYDHHKEEMSASLLVGNLH